MKIETSLDGETWTTHDRPRTEADGRIVFDLNPETVLRYVRFSGLDRWKVRLRDGRIVAWPPE